MSVNNGDEGRGDVTRPIGDKWSCRRRPFVARALAIGGTAFCLALIAEYGAPAADALTLLLPMGPGNAMQIDILEGNVFDPQFGLEGNGNASNNTAIGNMIMGLGNHSQAGTSGSDPFGVIALGGAQGNGNITEISILSYNIFNPQFSLDGSNVSDNTAIANVAADNGNHSQNEVTSDGGAGVGLFGTALGNGNTAQYAFLSANILNPQFSLFGDNTSTNTAVTNASMYNGNWSENLVSGGGFGTGLFGGATGNGNAFQYGGGVTNIFNPQFSLLGGNDSVNDATTNLVDGNGNNSANQVESTDGLANNAVVGGASGNGNVNQTVGAGGNIVNDQLSLGNEILLPGMQESIKIPGTELLKAGAQQTNAAVADAVSADKPLGKAVSGVKKTVDQARNAVNKAIKKHVPYAGESKQPANDAPNENSDPDK
jgi:hypothetical protein